MARPALNRKTMVGSLAAVVLTATAGASAIAVNAGLLGSDPAPKPFDAVPAATRDDMSAVSVTAPPTSIITIDEIVYENGAAVTTVDGATVTTPTALGNTTPTVARSDDDRDEYEDDDAYENGAYEKDDDGPEHEEFEDERDD